MKIPWERQTTWSTSAQVPVSLGERSLRLEPQNRWRATANLSLASICPASARFRFQQSAVRGMAAILKLQGPVRTTYKTSQHAFLWANSSQSLEFPVLENRPWSMASWKKPSLKSSTAIRKNQGNTRRFRGLSISIAWSTLIKARLVGLLVPIQRPIQASSMTFAISLLRPMKPKFGAIKKAALVSMSRAGVVKPAQEMGSSRLKCTSCQMSSFLVRSAMDVVTIVRPLKSTTRKKILQKCWIWRSTRQLNSSSTFQKLNANSRPSKMWAWAM